MSTSSSQCGDCLLNFNCKSYRREFAPGDVISVQEFRNRTCSNCGTLSQTLLRCCEQCRYHTKVGALMSGAVRYCNHACQKAPWKHQKSECPGPRRPLHRTKIFNQTAPGLIVQDFPLGDFVDVPPERADKHIAEFTLKEHLLDKGTPAFHKCLKRAHRRELIYSIDGDLLCEEVYFFAKVDGEMTEHVIHNLHCDSGLLSPEHVPTVVSVFMPSCDGTGAALCTQSPSMLNDSRAEYLAMTLANSGTSEHRSADVGA